MKLKKADWVIVREAEEQGLMVGMTGQIERKRTDLNNELSDYFRKQLPGYTGSFDENEGEEILYSINEYIAENKIDMYPLDFPITDGTDVYLIPITENIQLKVIVTDEYHGSGDYSKYVMADFFLINDKATTKDVDTLLQFVKKHLLQGGE
ncbi:MULTISPECIES: hypothetical protein [Bacillus amyloliquefaciens group]|uniref:Uncharacterized protein n=1 Tax=Bacillus velezensis TaxID=492670 RepID=A0ABC8D9N1_BACVE|nr:MULTISPECIES: hypothetical protein [Bacillus amyloliquefaciens group]ANB49335.1 hypothetical protein A1D33_018775 [Bacillus velezensis]AVI28934.1 hypothetical protein C3Z10_11345 [Bacillus velezensis]AWX72588.1 hypothetical protein BVDSYZ_11370 [Bacillus velezensis]MCX4184197.1 hypothetical protein [Bacillus amyloliquefaciens]MDK2560103.1 hypothetical protein [Bacillus amyloliquefaciens]